LRDEIRCVSNLIPHTLIPLQTSSLESFTRDFHNFDAWQKAHALTLAIYRLTEDFPKSESFGLVMSMRRSAGNIAMKIA